MTDAADLTADQLAASWRTFDCDYCIQTGNHRCRTKSGALCPPHVNRRVKYAAYLDGQASRQGEVDGATATVAQLTAQTTDLSRRVTEAAEDLATAQATAASLAEQLKTARAGAALVPGLQQQVAELLAKIALLENPPAKPATLLGYWPGGSAATPKDEDGDKDIDWYDDYFRVQRYLGPAQILRDFPAGSGLDVIPKSFATTRAANLRLKAFSISFTKVGNSGHYADWISGKAGDLLAAFLATIPADVHCYWCPHHEPQPELTVAQIAAMWTKVLTQVPKAPNLHPTAIPMGFDWTSKRWSDDSLVDGIEVLAPDIYLTNGTPQSVFAPSIATAKKLGLRYGVSECAKAQSYLMPGLTDDQTSVALVEYITTEVPKLIPTDYVTLFESNKSDGNWLLQDDTAAVSAWAAAK